MDRQTVVHTLAPVFAPDARVLILGTMPSPKSRAAGFYYGHPQNRFWKVMAALFSVPVPQTNEEKTAFCHAHKIALWDVLSSCSIVGASDQSIRDPVANDLSVILRKAPIQAIFTTGKKAWQLYQTLCYPTLLREATALASPSAANAGVSLEKLTKDYEILLQYTRL